MVGGHIIIDKISPYLQDFFLGVEGLACIVKNLSEMVPGAGKLDSLKSATTAQFQR